LVALGTPAELMSGEGAAVISFEMPPGLDVDDLPRLDGRIARNDTRIVVETDRATRDMLALTSWADGRGVDLASLTLTRPTLEDVFLSLTGGGGEQQ
jgi:ABC-2 type transport system ATP-binding protein